MVYHMQISVQCCQFHGNIALLRAQWSHFGPNFWARKMAHITVRASLLKFGLRDGPGLNQFLLVVPRDGTGPKKGPDCGPYRPFTVRALARFNSRVDPGYLITRVFTVTWLDPQHPYLELSKFD